MAKTPAPSRAVTIQKPAASAPAKTGGKAMTFSEEVPDHIKRGTGRGSENVTTNDMVIPRIEIVQSLSPQRKKSDPKYINGADDGDIFNTVTNQLLERPVTIVPVYFKKEYVVWVDRDSGGGFKGAFDTEAEAKARSEEVEEGTQVIDTHQHFVLIVSEDGSVEEAVLSMAKTKAKVSRRWNSMIRMNGGDRFSRGYRLDTVEESNDQGEFYNFDIKPLGFTPEPVYKHAEKLYEAITQGQRAIHREDSGSDVDDEESEI